MRYAIQSVISNFDKCHISMIRLLGVKYNFRKQILSISTILAVRNQNITPYSTSVMFAHHYDLAVVIDIHDVVSNK